MARRAPILQGPRVCLRPPRWDEMAFVRWLWADEETMRPVGGPVLLDDEQAREWFARVVDPGSPTVCYCLILDEFDRPIGEISYHHLDPTEMTAHLNIKIAALHRGRGYAREALTAWAAHFFQQGGRMLIDDVALDNVGGQQALLGLGFRHDPDAPDVFRLILTRAAFAARQEAA
ncbi:MAG: GNAT family N-acetyltransferase [Chloroflexi bacterium]|nr:GNAT family N-acetyltransferase [Chloroflexota bacterium]MBU1751822.1 GNAT family N-acetyltransferase [Chloroflexota bacterium]MBU1878731.1 GNAT family N-acetyltransferase [Chloroflexota bacterium]